MRRYCVYVRGSNSRLEPLDHHQGSFLHLKDAREKALSFFSQTRNVQIFMEQEIKLPMGWMLFRTRKLTNWTTGETL